MAENTGMWKLSLSDSMKALITAVFTAVFVAVYGFVSQADFNLFTADWGAILSQALSVGFAAAIGYLGKNLVTDKQGKVFGKI